MRTKHRTVSQRPSRWVHRDQKTLEYSRLFTGKQCTQKLFFPTILKQLLLQVFDKDNDGFITSDELKEALQTLGDRLTEEEVRHLPVTLTSAMQKEEPKTKQMIFLLSMTNLQAEERVKQVDKDGDGKIDIKGKLRSLT